MVFAVGMMTVGCASHKQKIKSDVGDITVKELKTLPSFLHSVKYLSAKTKLSLNLNGQNLSANGNIKMKRGEGIQIGINALGGLVEVARIEFNPERILFIYRLGKEYAEIRYTDIPSLEQAGIDYTVLESVFMNEVFVSSDKSLVKELDKMDISIENGEITVVFKQNEDVRYKFLLQRNDGLLFSTEGIYSDKISVTCNYSDFKQTNNRIFPEKMCITVGNATMEFLLNSPKFTAFDFNETKIVSSYTKVDFSKMLNGIKF